MKWLSKIKSWLMNLNFFVYLVTILVGALILLFNYEALLTYQRSGGFTAANLYEVIFVNLILSSVFLLKLSLPKIMNDQAPDLNEFFEMNNEEKPITFSVFVNFLSEQALGAFLATVIVITGKDIISDYGVVFGAMYTFLMYIFIIVIMTTSMVKLISYFVKRRKREYFVTCCMSALVLFSFFRLGLSMA